MLWIGKITLLALPLLHTSMALVPHFMWCTRIVITKLLLHVFHWALLIYKCFRAFNSRILYNIIFFKQSFRNEFAKTMQHMEAEKPYLRDWFVIYQHFPVERMHCDSSKSEQSSRKKRHLSVTLELIQLCFAIVNIRQTFQESFDEQSVSCLQETIESKSMKKRVYV